MEAKKHSKRFIVTTLIALLFTVCQVQNPAYGQEQTEKWKVLELKFKGPSHGNPFIDVQLSGMFIHEKDTVVVSGFYDGEGIYKMRFMPEIEGKWRYVTSSNISKLNNRRGSLFCTLPQNGNHGPVVVTDDVFFAYADGTPHHSFGTTCYAWVHQTKDLITKTLKTLSNGYFNKMRMCIFPKSYDWNNNEPLLYPFEGKPLTNWDYTRFNPEYFRNIEEQIAALDEMGIEADLIVFHPYDRWDFSKMDRETEERYIKYIIARFAAYKNVWWSMANEFDYIKHKTDDDWLYYLEMFNQNDPYNHLRSIHNGSILFDHTNPNITHVSIQDRAPEKGKHLRQQYRKPIVFDECIYEGNIPWDWGNQTPQEMLNKFWKGLCSGSYVGHSECYITEYPRKWPGESDDTLWWSKGGILRGESPERIKFLRQIIETSPGRLDPAPSLTDWMSYPVVTYNEDYFLIYFHQNQSSQQILHLPEDKKYKIEIIDTWDMTITPLKGIFSGVSLVELPGKPLIALRITKI